MNRNSTTRLAIVCFTIACLALAYALLRTGGGVGARRAAADPDSPGSYGNSSSDTDAPTPPATNETPPEVQVHVETVCINIRPLINEVLDRQRAGIPPRSPITAPVPATQSGGGLFAGGPAEITENEIVDEIVSLIFDTIAADTWRSNGGTVGSARAIGGVLIITQTPQTIRQIRMALTQLWQALHHDDFSAASHHEIAAKPASSPSTQPVTQCINIRSLIVELVNGPGIRRSVGDTNSPLTPADVVDGINKLIFENIGPDTWSEKGGSIGKLNNLAGMLVITQTPANQAAIRDLLQSLHHAASDVKPATLPATQSSGTIAGDGGRVTVMFNIRPLIDELRMGKGWNVSEEEVPSRRQISDELIKLLSETIEPYTWLDAGGSVGSLGDLGGVLVVSHTPRVVERVRAMLDELHATAITEPRVPTTHPAATTRAQAGDDGEAITEFFNLRPMMVALGVGTPVQTPMGRERGLATFWVETAINGEIVARVDPDSWQVNGGIVGRIQVVGGILVVTQTPAVMEKVRAELGTLDKQIAKGEFPPTTQPARGSP